MVQILLLSHAMPLANEQRALILLALIALYFLTFTIEE